MADSKLQQDLRLKRAEEALAGLRSDELDTVLAHRGFFRYLLEDMDQPLSYNEALLHKMNMSLEQRVAERTAELAAKNRELQSLNRTVQRLSRSTQEAMENDRRNIARDLHDGIGASLAAIKFGLEQRLADMEKGPDDSIISLEDLLTQIKATIKEIKRISQGLHPATLEELGLSTTMESHIRALAEVYPDIKFNSQLELPEEKIPDAIQIVLYRVLQEALNNICRHSNADNVVVRLTGGGGHLSFEVRDDGHGFVLSDNRISDDTMTGYGLQRMRDSVVIGGGEFLIESGPNQGTRVQVRFPHDSQ